MALMSLEVCSAERVAAGESADNTMYSDRKTRRLLKLGGFRLEMMCRIFLKLELMRKSCTSMEMKSR